MKKNIKMKNLIWYWILLIGGFCFIFSQFKDITFPNFICVTIGGLFIMLSSYFKTSSNEQDD
jgi:hypothetical protein